MSSSYVNHLQTGTKGWSQDTLFKWAYKNKYLDKDSIILDVNTLCTAAAFSHLDEQIQPFVSSFIWWRLSRKGLVWRKNYSSCPALSEAGWSGDDELKERHQRCHGLCYGSGMLGNSSCLYSEHKDIGKSAKRGLSSLLSIVSLLSLRLSPCSFDPICPLHLLSKRLAASLILGDIPTYRWKLQQSRRGGGAVCLICQLISTSLSDDGSVS